MDCPELHFVELVFARFLQTGESPLVNDVRRELFRLNVNNFDIQAVADTKPRVPGQLAPVHQDHISLGARYLLDVPAAAPILGLLVDATLEAVSAYRSSDLQPAVRYDNPRFFGYDSETVARFVPFVTADYPNAFVGGAYGGQWVL